MIQRSNNAEFCLKRPYNDKKIGKKAFRTNPFCKILLYQSKCIFNIIIIIICDGVVIHNFSRRFRSSRGLKRRSSKQKFEEIISEKYQKPRI